MTEDALGKFLFGHWPYLTVLTILILLAVRSTWSISNAMSEFKTGALLMQKDIKSLTESVRALRDSQADMEKYAKASMVVLIKAHRAGMLKFDPEDPVI